jgi:flagellar basal body-associated protein FliL
MEEDTPQSEKKKHKALRMIGITLPVLLALMSVAALAYAWQQNQTLHSEIKDKDVEISELSKEVEALNPDENSSQAASSDMVTYKPPVRLSNTDDTAKLTNAPESLRSFFAEAIDKDNLMMQSPDCHAVIEVTQVYKQRYAVGSTSSEGSGDCIGGAAVLWGMANGEWMQIAGTQNVGFECDKLKTHKVPSAIAGTTCMDSTGPKTYSRD